MAPTIVGEPLAGDSADTSLYQGLSQGKRSAGPAVGLDPPEPQPVMGAPPPEVPPPVVPPVVVLPIAMSGVPPPVVPPPVVPPVVEFAVAMSEPPVLALSPLQPIVSKIRQNR